jgi:hypothetical protein
LTKPVAVVLTADATSAGLLSRGETSRIVWFAMGVVLGALATGFGVWLGARYFH